MPLSVKDVHKLQQHRTTVRIVQDSCCHNYPIGSFGIISEVLYGGRAIFTPLDPQIPMRGTWVLPHDITVVGRNRLKAHQRKRGVCQNQTSSQSAPVISVGSIMTDPGMMMVMELPPLDLSYLDSYSSSTTWGSYVAEPGDFWT